MSRLWLLRFFSLICFVVSISGWISQFQELWLSEFSRKGGNLFQISVLIVMGSISLASLALGLLSFLPAAAQKIRDRFYHCLESSFVAALLFVGFFIVFIFSAIYYLSASPSLFGPVYPVWMMPLFAWLMSISLLALTFVTLARSGNRIKNLLVLFLLLAVLILGIGVNLQFWNYGSPRKEDVYYIYLYGQSLLNRINPYEAILSGDMLVNQKYATYLPLMYLLSWVTQAAGLTAFGAWLSFWRVIFLVFNLSIASLLFYIPVKKNLIVLSLFGSLFWLFNRWTLHVGKTADIDFVAIFFLLLSLFFFSRHRVLAYLLFGASLGVKQIGIFLLPLYLIWAWNQTEAQPWKSVGKAVFWIALIPALISLPFLVWNWEGFIRSILFSATRLAMASFDVYSLDEYIGIKGIVARLPLGAMLLLVYWIAWRRDFGVYLPALLIMTVFVFFNPVMFTSYMVWVVPLIPLVASNYLSQVKQELVS